MDIKPTITIKQLIEELQKYPPDMLVSTRYDPFDEISIQVLTWQFDKKIKYLNLV